MSQENNQTGKTLDQTIDALFSDKPSAPVKSAPTAPATAPSTAPAAPAAQKAAAGGSTAPAASSTPAKPAAAPSAPRPNAAPAAQGGRQSISMSDLVKMIQAPRPSKPMEKTPVWVGIMTVCTIILSLIIMMLTVVGTFVFFSGAILSQILCALFGIVLLAFNISCMFVLRVIEKGIREIKSKL